VVIEDVFRSELVADDNFCPTTIEVPAGASVSFTLVISGGAQHRITARLMSGAKSIGETIVQATSPSEAIEIRFTVDNEPVVIDPKKLERDSSRTPFLNLLRPMECFFASQSIFFGDLQKKEAAESAETLKNPAAPRVTAIIGEAGVGKTYFCE